MSERKTKFEFWKEKYVLEKEEQTCGHCGFMVVPKPDRSWVDEDEGFMFHCPMCGVRLGFGGRLRWAGGIPAKETSVRGTPVRTPEKPGDFRETVIFGERDVLSDAPSDSRPETPESDITSGRKTVPEDAPRLQCPRCLNWDHPVVGNHVGEFAMECVCGKCGERLGSCSRMPWSIDDETDGESFTKFVDERNPHIEFRHPGICVNCGRWVQPVPDLAHVSETEGHMFHCPACGGKLGYGGLNRAWNADGSRRRMKFQAERLGIRRCQICGAEKPSLQAHHLVPLREGGLDVRDNVVILCEECHELVHHLRNGRKRREEGERPEDGDAE